MKLNPRTTMLGATIFVLICGGCSNETISSITIPDTDLTIQLIGPDSKNHYSYVLLERDTAVAKRFLGPATIEQWDSPTVRHDGDGALKVSWGSKANAAFVEINAVERLIVRDSNQANTMNSPF